MIRALSHYRIDGEIGRGGMGIVYRAYDERLHRAVALKVLPDAIAADPRRRAQIFDEARAASALNHPGITTIHDVGEDADAVFIVMELVAGRTLRSVLTDGPLAIPTLARIGVHLADALAGVHAHGVVHGDIKPENVMVQPDGRVKLLDFGIARRPAFDTAAATGAVDIAFVRDATEDLHLSGTLPYMAPELLADGVIDARSDLFSLGVLLYECVAQGRPFSGATPAALLRQILSAEPLPLATVAPRVPAALAGAIHKALQKSPAERYQHARELHADLAGAVRDLELEAILPSAIAGRRAVAVLPFALLTPNSADEYLSGALADAVINRLSAGGSLLVRPTSTVMRYAHQTMDPLRAGRELNVDVVVDGSIQKVDQRLRVHVQARDVRDGSSLLSARHEADAADLFGLQDAVADAIGSALGLVASDHAETSEPPTTNRAAYELFLRAGERLSRFNKWDTRTAIDMLEDVTRLDPSFADAWARLGEACAHMHLGFEPGGGWLHTARRAIRRALALNSRNALTYSAQARILWNPTAGFKIRASLRATARALALNPGCQPAWTWQGILFHHVGLQDDARRSLTAALASNPHDSFAVPFIGQSFFAQGDYDGAQDFTERALAMERGNLYANLFLPIVALYRGDGVAFTKTLRQSRATIGDDPMFVSFEALLLAKEGRRAKARTTIEKALTGKSLAHTHHTVHLAAATYALLGDAARSVALLRKAATIGFPTYTGFRDDPHFASLHRYGPFLKLMAALRKECAGYQREFGSAAVNPSPDSPIQVQ